MAYRFLPHRLLNGAAGWLARRRRPAALVQAIIRRWATRDAIPLDEFEPGPWASVHDFFLRRLRRGARPLGSGIVAPVDGVVVAAGRLDGGTLTVKGQRLRLAELLVGRAAAAPELAALAGGRYVALFLSPDGYHRVHMPADGELVAARWLPGRFFPQNLDALAVHGDVYCRNERVALRLRLRLGAGPAVADAWLVLVGASLVGGIELEGVARAAWARAGVTPLGLDLHAGDELGHFELGSTVVVLLPPTIDAAPRHALGDRVRMGEALFTIGLSSNLFGDATPAPRG